MSIGERLNSLRGKKSLAEMSDLFGVSAQQLSKIENNKSAPSLELAMKICEHFGVSLDWLLLGKEPEAPKATNVTQPGYVTIPAEELIELQRIALNKTIEEKKQAERKIEQLKNDQ